MQIKASTRELARENDHAVNPVRRVEAVVMGSSPQGNSSRVSPSRTRVVSECGSVRETETDFGACAVRRGRGTDQFAAAVAWLLPIGPAGGERGKPWGPCPSVSKARTRLLRRSAPRVCCGLNRRPCPSRPRSAPRGGRSPPSRRTNRHPARGLCPARLQARSAHLSVPGP